MNRHSVTWRSALHRGALEHADARRAAGAEHHHTLDQFVRLEEGVGEALLDGVRTAILAGFAVLVPAGTDHNIINTGSIPMKLCTLYAPPNHRHAGIQHTGDVAEADAERFDGNTTE